MPNHIKYENPIHENPIFRALKILNNSMFESNLEKILKILFSSFFSFFLSTKELNLFLKKSYRMVSFEVNEMVEIF